MHEWNEPSCLYSVSIHQMAPFNRGKEGRHRRRRRGEEWGGLSPSPANLGACGSVVCSPSRVWAEPRPKTIYTAF